MVEVQQHSAIALTILQGFPTLLSLSKPKRSLMSNAAAQDKSVALWARIYWGDHWYQLLARLSWLSLTPPHALAQPLPTEGAHGKRLSCPGSQSFVTYQYSKHSRTKHTTTHLFLPSKKWMWIERSICKVIPCSGSMHRFGYIAQHLRGTASLVSP